MMLNILIDNTPLLVILVVVVAIAIRLVRLERGACGAFSALDRTLSDEPPLVESAKNQE